MPTQFHLTNILVGKHLSAYNAAVPDTAVPDGAGSAYDGLRNTDVPEGVVHAVSETVAATPRTAVSAR